jgi:hypothetical protein
LLSEIQNLAALSLSLSLVDSREDLGKASLIDDVEPIIKEEAADG